MTSIRQKYIKEVVSKTHVYVYIVYTHVYSKKRSKMSIFKNEMIDFYHTHYITHHISEKTRFPMCVCVCVCVYIYHIYARALTVFVQLTQKS